LTQPIKVRILDHEYLIKSDEDVEQVFKIAQYVTEKLKEVNDTNKGLSVKKTAILTALNIASEYFQIQKERDDLLTEIRQRAKTLIYNIDSVMR
jgi:cell division protein ZapA